MKNSSLVRLVKESLFSKVDVEDLEMNILNLQQIQHPTNGHPGNQGNKQNLMLNYVYLLMLVLSDYLQLENQHY